MFRGTKVYRTMEKRDDFHFSNCQSNVAKMTGLITSAIMIDDCHHWLVKHPIEYPTQKDKDWHDAQISNPWKQVSTILEKSKDEQYAEGQFTLPLYRATDSGAASSSGRPEAASASSSSQPQQAQGDLKQPGDDPWLQGGIEKDLATLSPEQKIAALPAEQQEDATVVLTSTAEDLRDPERMKHNEDPTSDGLEPPRELNEQGEPVRPMWVEPKDSPFDLPL